MKNKMPFTWRKNFNCSPEQLKRSIDKLLPYEVPLQLVGGDKDGGYLIPTPISINALFSPGVNNCDDFELFFARQGIDCYLADFSINQNPTKHENIKFDKIFIGNTIEPDRRFISLDDWVRKYKPNTENMLLQMDIEGWEYNTITHSSREILNKFDYLCIEFHNFHLIGKAFSNYFMDMIFEKLLIDFYPVHVHANNSCDFEIIHGFVLPNAIEITFQRKKIEELLVKRTNLSHKLDIKNDKLKPHIDLNSWITKA